MEADIFILFPFRFRFLSVMWESCVVIPSVFCQVSCYASVTLPLSFRSASVMRVDGQIQVISESWACLRCGPNNLQFVSADVPKAALGHGGHFRVQTLPFRFRYPSVPSGAMVWELLGSLGQPPRIPKTYTHAHSYTYNPTTNNESFGNARPRVPFV